MSRWEQFFKNIQQDLKLYLFILMLFCLFRISFIAVLHTYLATDTTLKDIFISLYYGIRISLKSAGIVALLSFLFCTLLTTIFKTKKLAAIRQLLGYIYISILTLLFFARIPYYEQFHMAFNQFLFNTFKDDVIALFYTLVQQYNLFVRLLATCAVAFILSKLLKAWLYTKTYSWPQADGYRNIALRAATIFCIAAFMLFSRFGGSFTYAHSIHWENAAVTKDEFLNEAILDDIQAMYRAYRMHMQLKDARTLNISAEKLASYAEHLAGHKVASNNIDDFLQKQAQGAKIKKPRHIFLIIGESYAQWPLLDKYKNLHIADGVKHLMTQQNAASVRAFLPNGTGTMEAINGIVTGMPEVNLYPNYQPETYKEPYASAFGAQMKKLGYKTQFWYGGFYSWQRIKDFTLSQGFDEFHSCSDFKDNSGNAWGMDDKPFLDQLAANFQDDQPNFYVILTVSNHPPYTVNLQQEGFDEQVVKKALPAKQQADKDLIKILGHYWYSDKVLAEFVQKMHANYPDSLFIITGDHADRTNIDANPSLFERYTLPLIFYGQGIHKNILPNIAAGGQINIMPTLIELIAPKDFTYYSIGQSLTTSQLGMNQQMWITNDFMAKTSNDKLESLPHGQTLTPPNIENIKQDLDAALAVSWWRIQHGKYINQ